MTDHRNMTGVNTLAISGNPVILGKQSGKSPFRLNSNLWKQLRSTTWQPMSTRRPLPSIYIHIKTAFIAAAYNILKSYAIKKVITAAK